MKLESLKTLKKAFWAIFLLIVLFSILKIFARLTFLNWFYTPLLTLLTEKFGPATAITKITALVGSLSSLMILPTIIALIIWGKKKKEIFVTLSIIFLFLCAILFYESKTVFFDSNTGEGIKYYCITVDGVKFSNQPGIDSASGIAYKPITKILIKKYQIWQKHKKGEVIPYFDTATGEPNFKYGEDSNKNIILYPTLYEFDPTTGEKLGFINQEIVGRYLETKKNNLSAQPGKNILKENGIVGGTAKAAWGLAFGEKKENNISIVVQCKEKKIINTVSVPDKTTIFFESDNDFYIVEKTGIINGEEQLVRIIMPKGKSKRFFTWGGVVKIEGIYDTSITITY